MNIIDVGLQFGDMDMSNRPSMKIVHHLEAEGINWTVQTIHNMHISEHGWAGIGYHYYIRLDGTIYKGRPDNAIGAHCQGCNTNTLGIAFEGNYDNRETMPAAQFNAWCQLSAYLDSKYGVMLTFGHREKGSSECPGELFPLAKVKAGKSTKYNIGWTKDGTGWYYSTDGTNFYQSSWQLINGLWYSFDASGYARCSTWFKDGTKWYYLQADCDMAFNEWLQIKGVWYRFDASGAMLENQWYQNAYKEWYYLGKDGAMVTGSATIDNKPYLFDANGKLIS